MEGENTNNLDGGQESKQIHELLHNLEGGQEEGEEEGDCVHIQYF